MPRTVTASAWQPVLPDCPASTGRNVARITSRSTVPWKTATTPPAANAVSQVDEKPWIAELEALRERGRHALLPLDTDHRARLRGDLESLELEQRRAAHQPDQVSLGVANRIRRGNGDSA
jgi:hypothetical protein